MSQVMVVKKLRVSGFSKSFVQVVFTKYILLLLLFLFFNSRSRCILWPVITLILCVFACSPQTNTLTKSNVC